MDKIKIQQLLLKYDAGIASKEEAAEIEKLIEQGIIEISEIKSLHSIERKIEEISTIGPSMQLDRKFYQMLSAGKKQPNYSWQKVFSLSQQWFQQVPRLAFASVALLIGFGIGFWIKSDQPETQQMQMLTQQVADLKEMMMLSMLEKESAVERLKAVNLTQGMDQASKNVTHALLQTLNNDTNVNVRLAALDALRPYVKDSDVRQALIHSITMQQSPLVQIALAELMAAFQVKSSVKELKKVLKNENTPRDVKKKIERTIEVLT